MPDERIGAETGDPLPFGAKGDKHDGHPGGAGCAIVRLGIADQDRPRDLSARLLDRQPIGRGIGLANGQGVGPHKRGEKTPRAQPCQQKVGQPLRFVRADPHRHA